MQDDAALSPLTIVLSLYNQQVEAVDALEWLMVFNTTGGHRHLRRDQVSAIARAFERCFSMYLKGIGHVPDAVSGYVTAEEYELCVHDRLFWARVTLCQLTDSWLLPVGDGSQSKIKVRLHPAIHQNPIHP